MHNHALTAMSGGFNHNYNNYNEDLELNHRDKQPH